MHSRNFSLQKAGDSDWILKNYNFEKVSRFIDEIIFLDVSRKEYLQDRVMDDFKKVTNNCFVPISFGGKLRSDKDIENCFLNGADKIVINSLVNSYPDLVMQISRIYGAQSIIASIDVKKIGKKYLVFVENGSINTEVELHHYIDQEVFKQVGEVYLNSIDKDGTGQGYDEEMLLSVENKLDCPIILAGGAGNSRHFLKIFKNTSVDALATANLFNFIGDGLENTREELINENISFPLWEPEYLDKIKSKLNTI